MHDESFIHYAEGFVQECFDRGLTEKQADQLYTEMVNQGGHIKEARFGINKLKSIYNWAKPVAAGGTAAKQYTAGSLASSAVRTGAIGGAGYGAWKGGDWALNKIRPGAGNFNLGDMDPAFFQGSGNMPQSGGGSAAGSRGRSTSAMEDMYGRSLLGEETSARGGGSAGMFAGSGSVYDRKNTAGLKNIQGLNKNIMSLEKQLQEAKDNMYDDPGAVYRAKSLQEELNAMTKQRDSAGEHLTKLRPHYEKTQADYEKKRAQLQLKAAEGYDRQSQLSRAQVDAMAREMAAPQSTGWLHKGYNRVRGYSPTNAERAVDARKRYEESQRVLNNAPDKPYF